MDLDEAIALVESGECDPSLGLLLLEIGRRKKGHRAGESNEPPMGKRLLAGDYVRLRAGVLKSKHTDGAEGVVVRDFTDWHREPDHARREWCRKRWARNEVEVRWLHFPTGGRKSGRHRVGTTVTLNWRQLEKIFGYQKIVQQRALERLEALKEVS